MSEHVLLPCVCRHAAAWQSYTYMYIVCLSWHDSCTQELAGGSMTFKPEINRRSVVLAEARLRQAPDEVGALPVAERLYRAASSPSRGNRQVRLPYASMLAVQSCHTQHPVGLQQNHKSGSAELQSVGLPATLQLTHSSSCALNDQTITSSLLN